MSQKRKRQEEPSTDRAARSKRAATEKAKKHLANKITSFIAERCDGLCLEIQIFYGMPVLIQQAEEVRSVDSYSTAYVTSPQVEKQKRALKRFVENALLEEHKHLTDGITLVRIDYHQLLEEEEEPHDTHKEYSLCGPVHSRRGTDGIIEGTKIRRT